VQLINTNDSTTGTTFLGLSYTCSFNSNGPGLDNVFPYDSARVAYTSMPSGYTGPYSFTTDTPQTPVMQVPITVPQSFSVHRTLNMFTVFQPPTKPGMPTSEFIPIIEQPWQWVTSDSSPWPTPIGDPQASSGMTQWPYDDFQWTQLNSNSGVLGRHTR